MTNQMSMREVLVEVREWIDGCYHDKVVEHYLKLIDTVLALPVEPSADVAKEARRKMTHELYDALDMHPGIDSLRTTLLQGEFGDELQRRNQAEAAPSDAGLPTPTPRGSLSNSLGTSSEKSTPSHLPVICGKPMPNGLGAKECINVPGHEGPCDDMPF